MEEQDKIKLIGKIKFHKNHKLYKLHMKTGELKVMELDPTMGGNILREPEYIYYTALNLKNAIRKADNWLGIKIIFKNK